MRWKSIRRLWLLLVAVSIWIISKEFILLGIVSPSEDPLSAEPTAFKRLVQIGSAFSYNGLSGKWVILDALTTECHLVRGFDQEEGWTVLVLVKKLQEIEGCFFPSCLQLTWEDYKQHMDHLSTTSLLKGLSKIAGYLFAISRGASVILDGDCTRPVTDIDQHFRLNVEHRYGLWYNDTLVFNPFQHMAVEAEYNNDPGAGQSNYQNSEIYFVSDFGRVSVRQGVFDRTCASSGSQTDITVDAPRLPIVVGPQTLSPLNTGPSVFRRDAFWWMFVPPVSDLSTSSIFRTCWLHAIKNSFLVNIGYYHTPSFRFSQVRTSADCPAKSFSSAIINLILTCAGKTKCSKTLSPIACGVKHAQGVLRCLDQSQHITGISSIFLELLLAWMDDILMMEVIEPKFLDLAIRGNNVYKIKYGFNMQDWNLFSTVQVQTLQQNIFQHMADTCAVDTNTYSKSLRDWKTPTMNDIALIIVLNYESLFPAVPYVEYVHRQSFKYVVYCGPAVENFIKFAEKTGVNYVTYIEGLTQGWYFMYECITHAMKLHLPVKGYLQIGDDILLNTWNLMSLPKDRIWMPKGFSKRDLYKTKFVKAWTHWNTTRGQNATIKVFAEMQKSISQSLAYSTSRSSREFHLFSKRFLDKYKSNIGMNFIIHRATDIFYIPEVLKHDYIIASELFRKHTSLIEMAVPVMHLGLAKKEDVIYMKGASLWGENRQNPWTFFAAEKTYFIHPFKTLSHLQTEGGRDFFCRTYLPEYESNGRKI